MNNGIINSFTFASSFEAGNNFLPPPTPLVRLDLDMVFFVVRVVYPHL